MNWSTVLALLPFAFAAIPIVAVGVVIVITMIKLGQSPKLPPAHTPTAPIEGSWNARLFTGQAVVAWGDFGVLEVRAGMIVFHSESGRNWSYPCADLMVTTAGFWTFGGSPLALTTPHGQYQIIVSRERINRAMANSMKTLRERRYATEVALALRSQGARVVMR